MTESIYALAGLLRIQGRFGDAEPLLDEASSYLQNGGAVCESFRRGVLERLVSFYVQWEKAAPDSGQAEKAVAWKQKLTDFDKSEATKHTASAKP